MKINIESEQPVKLPQPPEESEKPQRVVHVRDKSPAWKQRGDQRIREREAKAGRFTPPNSYQDWTRVLSIWFVVPTAYFTGFSLLETAGVNMGGIAALTVAIVVVVGVWMYNSLIAHPSDWNGVLLRIALLIASLIVGVVLVAI